MFIEYIKISRLALFCFLKLILICVACSILGLLINLTVLPSAKVSLYSQCLTKSYVLAGPIIHDRWQAPI